MCSVLPFCQRFLGFYKILLTGQEENGILNAKGFLKKNAEKSRDMRGIYAACSAVGFLRFSVFLP